MSAAAQLADECGPIVLFDGVCNLCNAVVRFVIARDPRGRVRFASLQSKAGKELLARYASQLPADALPTDDEAPPTFLLIEGERAYARSTAALRLCRYLSGLWPLLGVNLVVPAALRDPLYDLVAAKRYKWFGRTDACRLPTPGEAQRFLG